MARHPQLAAIGSRIRSVRRAKGWSQDKFAVEIGMARSYFGGVERGERNLSTLKLVKIAVALEVDPADFFPPVRDLKRLGKRRL